MDAIDPAKLTKGYVLDIFKAVGHKVRNEHAEAAALYLKVLEQNPWATGPYKDLGDTYMARFQTTHAWRCFEEARAISPRHGLLGEIDAYERRLHSDYPQFFLQRR